MALQQSSANQQQAAKDPVSYERLREAFIRDLHHFHDTRGTPFKKCPRVDGKEVDLYKLYTLVTARGGWISVNSKNEWVWLCEEFHLPSGCVNSGVGLKQIYLRYLDRYEKVHFLGEDGHQGDDDDEDSRHRKWNARSLHSVPLTYNHHQHNVAESLREYNGLSSDLYKPSNYDKLALSLISPLPNEQDFAINVCTFLSNEGKHTLRLDKYPRLVNHLLAHAGIFDSTGTRQLFIEVYSRVRNYSINSFWPDVLDAQDVLDLTDERIFIKKPITANSQRFIRRRQEKERQRSQQHQQGDIAKSLNDAPCSMDIDNGPLECDRLENGIEVLEERLNLHLIDETSSSSNSSSTFKDQNQNSIKFEDDDKDLFCVGRTLGTQDPYGQRVLQIAAILRNLSFTPENVAVLGRSRSFLRFVLLCVRARWCNLHQLGFDILGNIASEIVLKEAGERLTSVILSSVSKGIDSQDRFVVISCLEILNKISQQDLNEETLTFGLDDNVYELICRFLALSDIALLVYTLECLYALTSLGERPCTSVARVRGAIDTLVALVTVEAQSYGPKACILMRVVETVSSVPANQQQQQQQSPQVTPSQQSSPSPQQTISAAAAAAASSTVHHHASTAPSQGAPMATSVSEPAGLDGQIGSVGNPSGSGHVTEVVAVRLAPHQVQQMQQVKQQQQQTVQAVQVAQAAQVQTQPHTQLAQSQSPPIQATPTKVNASGGSSRPSTPKSAAAKAAANSLQQQHTHQQIIQENEQFALGWLKATFELSPGVKIEQEELYKKYLGCCTKIGRRGVIAPLHFPRCVRSVFGGTIGPNPIKGETTGTLYYEGIRVRSTPGQVTYPLKGMTRPNVIGNQAAENTSGNVVTVVGGTGNVNPAKVSVAHPHLSQALLASGAQQQSGSQQPPQAVQVIVKDDGRGGATSSSIIKSLLATKVAQRQQQQRQQQLQQTTGTTVGTPTKTIINTKGKPTIVTVKKVQRLNGAKVIVANNCEKPDAMETDNGLHAPTNQQTQLAIASIISPSSADVTNHVGGIMRVYRGPGGQQVLTTATSATAPNKQSNQQQLRNVCTSIVEDSDSTNNSLASSSGIGGSRDCSGVGAEEENSLTSFEGILLNGAPSNLDIDAQDDGSSKDSSSVGSKEKSSQSMMLADLLERKVEKEPIMNGILGKKDLVENHIKKVRVLKESPGDIKIKAEVSEDALIEAPPRVCIKRSASTNEADESCDTKKPKYSNGTTSPDPAVGDSTTISSIKSEEPDDEKEEKVTVSSTAANLYAALAADIIDDETDLEEGVVAVKEEAKPVVKEEVVKEEPQTPVTVNQIATSQEQQQPVQAQAHIVQVQTVTQPQAQVQQQPHQTHQTIAITQQQLQQQLQQGLIVAAAPRQIVVQQAIQSNNQIVTIPTTAMKGRPQHQIQPQVLQVQQGPSGQTHYVISGGVPGQNYVLAQPQTALVQGQAQTVLVAQQQGSNAKTIIILQPQASAQPQAQKMVAVTPQGQQVVVTQVPRPLLQSPAMGNIPPPLVPTSGVINQASIVVNSTVSQQIQQATQQEQTVSQQQTSSQVKVTQVQSQVQSTGNTVTVVQTQQAASVATAAANSVPSRVVTPTPASTPPPTRPTTPRQAAATQQTSTTVVPAKIQQQSTTAAARTSTDMKEVVMVTAATSTEQDNTESTDTISTTVKKALVNQDTSTSRPQSPAAPMKTITVTLERNAFLCEWRGCFKQFKNPRKVYLHVVEAHCPTGSEETLCQWASCDGLKRRRFSLMTHLFDRHCCDEVMLMRRKQFDQSGKTEYLTSKPVPAPTHHPGYAPNAALHAIKRHALEFVNPKELMDDNEGPVTKSIRLTAALILRNLVIYSAHGRRHLRAYEPHLAGVALSNVESSRTIAQVLYDMNDQSSSGHR